MIMVLICKFTFEIVPLASDLFTNLLKLEISEPIVFEMYTLPQVTGIFLKEDLTDGPWNYGLIVSIILLSYC